MGPDPHTRPLPEPEDPSGPRAVLEEAVLPALRRAPCLVSFSGGVDSSVVLAVATHVARRNGLPPPIPITNRFPMIEASDETDWQHRVVDHLELSDWVRLEWSDELDVVGPVATEVLRRHGILAPFNSHFHYPLLKRAAGGALLTGIGGDELFESVSRAAAARVLIQRRRPRVRDLRSVAFGLAPRPLRAYAKGRLRRQRFDRFAWIRPEKRKRLAYDHARWESHDPLCADRALRAWWWRSRLVQCNLAGKRALAADFDVLFSSPFLDPSLLSECALAGGPAGMGRGSRSRGFEQLVGDLLPEEVLTRTSKASFNGAFWNKHARALVEGWDGSGLDSGSIDANALRAEWLRPAPDAHSFVQLQRAWLASQPRSDA